MPNLATRPVRLVSNDMTVGRKSSTELVEVEALTVDHIVELHKSLLPDQQHHHGLRTAQNWIGGSNRTPIGADFVPPDHDRVEELMQDLVGHMNGAAHAPPIQAAIVHAQFETIHPFTDGNGRVGRALIHTVLARRGLTESAVLPISLVLAPLRDRYVDGLTVYRHSSVAVSASASEAINQWVSTFVHAASVAVEQSMTLMGRIDDLRSEWTCRLSQYRRSMGLRSAPRADSAVARLLEQLPEAPVVTAATLARILAVSVQAANAALEELRHAGIVSTKSIERGARAYLAREVFDLITHTERALASTRFDIRDAAPDRRVPALPQE